MRRMVIWIVVAAVLLSPACGMAAQEHGGKPALTSWWDLLVSWTTELLSLRSPKNDPVPVSPPSEEGGDPRIQAGTTWDDLGSP